MYYNILENRQFGPCINDLSLSTRSIILIVTLLEKTESEPVNMLWDVGRAQLKQVNSEQSDSTAVRLL